MFVEGENKAKEQYRRSLDSEIAEKEKQLKDERKAKVTAYWIASAVLWGSANPQRLKRKTPS